MWTAARVRGGTTVVKFSAREVEGGRCWLREMLREEERGEGEGKEGMEGGLEGGMDGGIEGTNEHENERGGIAGMFGEGGMMFLR